MGNIPRFHGPGMVDREGKLAKVLVDFLDSLSGLVTSANATATAAAQAVTSSSPITITGTSGVSVYGDASSGFQIVGPGTQPVPLSIGEDEIYTVAANTQVLYHTPIDVDGEIVVSGELIEVG